VILYNRYVNVINEKYTNSNTISDLIDNCKVIKSGYNI